MFNVNVDWSNSKDCLEAIKIWPLDLRYVETQTEEICLLAVRGNGYSLKHVIKQTPEICIEAIKSNKEAINYVDGYIYSEKEFRKFLLEERIKDICI